MADTDPVFRAVITAVDKATPVLDRIGAKIKAVGAYADLAATKNPWGEAAAAKVSLFTRALDGAHAAGERLASIGHVFREAREPVHMLAEGVKSLGERFKWVGEKATELLPMLGLLGGAASIAGIFELVHKATESFTELARGAEKIGITTAAMRQLSYIAEMTDTPVVALDSGLFRLNRTIADAAANKNKDAAALFHHLGIATRDATGHLRGAADLLPELQKAFRNTTDPAMRARMAMALFSRQGREMLPFLLAAPDDMRKWSDEASRMVYTFSSEDGENLEAFRIGWINLETAVGGFLDEVGAKLAPILTPVVNKISDWISVNRDWIATKIADAVRDLAKWVMTLDFDKIVKDTAAWFHRASDLVDKLGGLKTVIMGVIGVMAAPWVAAILGMVFTLARITFSVVRLTWALGTGLIEAITTVGGAFTALSARVMGLPLWALLARFSGIGTFIAGMWPGTANPVNGPAEQDPAFRNRRNGVPGVFHDELNAPAPPHDDASPGSGPWINPRHRADWSHDVYATPDGGGGDRGAGMPSVWQRLQSRLGGSQNGKVDVHVVIDGAPAGTSARATGTGITSDPTLDVGYAFPGMIPAS